jgi:hypothetical protein
MTNKSKPNRPARAGAFLLAVAVFCASAAAALAQSKEIIFLSGPKDHGVPGRHEYEKDLRVLAAGLEHSTNLKGVTTKVYVGAMTNLDLLTNAAAFVILSSGDGGGVETHPLFPGNPTTDGKSYRGAARDFLQGFNLLVRAGAGVVVLHYALQVQNLQGQKYYLNWLGGFYEPGYSSNPAGDWTMTPVEANKNHPVLRGVKAWTYHDEVFSKFLAEPMDPQRTDLIVGTMKGSNRGVVPSWAYQRTSGGRAFIYGGVDWHNAMEQENYRKLLLNGIAWAAHLEIPEGGVESPLIEPDPAVMGPIIPHQGDGSGGGRGGRGGRRGGQGTNAVINAAPGAQAPQTQPTPPAQ